MKKAALLTVISSVMLSVPVYAQNSLLTDEELTRVVCNHLEQTENTKTAIAKAYGETKNIIDKLQKETLKELAAGTLEIQKFCATIEN